MPRSIVTLCRFSNRDRTLPSVFLAAVALLAIGVFGSASESEAPVPFVRIGHAAGIASLAWQPGGRLIATAGLDNTALLWDSASGRPVAVLGGHRAAVVNLAWSPDGKLLATASFKGGATIWNASSGTALRVVGEAEQTLTALDWNPDSSSVALGIMAKAPGVEIWEAEGSARRRLGATPATVSSVRWSGDGRYLAAGLAGGEVLAWEPDLPDPQPRTLSRHTGPVTCLRWRPKAALLASASAMESRIQIHDAAAQKPALVFDGHRSGILSLAWSPDGARLASGSEDRNAVIWDSEGRALQRLTDHVGPVRALAWTPDGRQIATGSDDRSAITWNAETGDSKSVLTGLGHPVTALQWNRDGTRLVGASLLQSYALLWDPAAQEVRMRLAGSATPRQQLSWIGARRLLASSPENGVALWNLEAASRQSPPGGSREVRNSAAHSSSGKVAFNTARAPSTITIWSPADPPKKAPSTVQTPAPATVTQWSRDGNALLIGDLQGGVTLAPIATMKPATLPAHRQSVTALAVSSDGKVVISGGRDGSLAIFSRSPWRKVVSLLGSVPVEGLVVSPDGTRLAVEGPGGKGDLWDIPNRKLLRPFTGRLAAWSPSGKVLALDHGILNPATGAFTAGLAKEPAGITALAWRPDGASLAVAAADGSIILREPTTGGALATLVASGRPVISLAWSPDGRLLAAARSDGVIHLWKVEGSREVAQLYAFDSGSQWLLLTPAGHFTASVRGSDRLQWRVGETLHPVARYRERFENAKAVVAALR